MIQSKKPSKTLVETVDIGCKLSNIKSHYFFLIIQWANKLGKWAPRTVFFVTCLFINTIFG